MDPTVESLEGSGEKDIEEKMQEEESAEIKNQILSDPISFNEQKRKRMGSPIHESFQHPKMISTEKIQLLKNNNKPNNSSEKKMSSNQPKISKIKHKFQIY